MKPLSYKTLTTKAREEITRFATKANEATKTDERNCYAASANAAFCFWISLVGLDGPADYMSHYAEFENLVQQAVNGTNNDA